MKQKIDNQQPILGIPQSTKQVQRLTSEQESNKLDTNIPHPSRLKCSECKEVKDSHEFYISTKYSKRGYDYRCKKCCKSRSVAQHFENRDAILLKWKNTRDSLTTEQKKDIAIKSKEWYRNSIKKRLLARAKDRSKRLGMYCNIDISDIIITEKCPLLEIPFEYGSTHNKWLTYSIDRIDNTKGYVKGNIQIITYLANTMKSKATIPQLRTFAKNILLQFKDDDIV